MKLGTKITTGIIFIVLAVLIIIGVSNNQNKGFRIGAVIPLTGPSASIGEMIRQGYEFKVAELKEKGVAIEFFAEDSASDPKQAVTAFTDLTNVKKVSVIYTVTSGDSMPIKPLVESQKNTILWADATHPALTENSSYVLRHASTANDGARLIAENILQTKVKSVGVLYQQDDYGKAFNQLLTDNLTQGGVKVFSEQIDNKYTDFRAQISKIKANNPDVIVNVILGPAVGIAIKQSRELGYSGKLYSGVGFALSPDASKIAGSYAKGLLYQKYPQSEQFSKDYQKKFGKPGNTLGYVSYTDTEILENALEQTRSTDPRVLINYIKNLGTFQGTYEKVTIQKNGDIVIPTTIEIWE